MAQNEKSHNIVSILGDMALTAVAVSIVAITFYGVSGLTPKPFQQQATNGSAVLGVTTKQQALTYFPTNTNQIPFINSYTLSRGTSLDSSASIQIAFTPLEASTYDFTAVTIKNSSQEYRKLSLTPSYSLEGSYTTVTMMYAGQSTELIAVNGQATPVDLVIPPNTTTEIALKVQPAIKLATPVQLSLDFTEVP